MKKFISLKGKLSWVKHLKPDDKFGDPKWSLRLHPDADSLAIINDLKSPKEGIEGIMNKLQKDEDGYYMAFSRPCSKVYQGKMVPFLPPTVLNADGSPMTDKAVGNGSDGTVTIEWYTFNRKAGGGKGSAVRWDSLRVDNLIPYEPKRDLTPEDYKSVARTVEVPKPMWS